MYFRKNIDIDNYHSKCHNKFDEHMTDFEPFTYKNRSQAAYNFYPKSHKKDAATKKHPSQKDLFEFFC
jgi:hypothetical protein